MSKKIVIFITLILGSVSLFIVGIWGAVPDPSDKIPINYVSFIDGGDYKIDVKDDNKKLVNAKDFIVSNKLRVYFKLDPHLSNKNKVRVTIDDESSEYVVLNTSLDKGYVDLEFINQISEINSITLKITDGSTEHSDQLDIILNSRDSTDGPIDFK